MTAALTLHRLFGGRVSSFRGVTGPGDWLNLNAFGGFEGTLGILGIFSLRGMKIGGEFTACFLCPVCCC